MAGDGVNVPLLLRTARTLRERFEALRPVGPVPAVMAETPPGERYPSRVEGGQPLPIFESHDLENPRWQSGAMVIRDGAYVANRDIWLAGDWEAARRLLLVCHDANGFVPMLRHEFGLHADCGTSNAKQRWLWTVFELAERGIPGSLLSLLMPVFRCSPDGVVRVSETDIRWAQEHPGESGFFPDFFRGEFNVARHWQLADLVEASIMVMDVAEAAAATVMGPPVSIPVAPSHPRLDAKELDGPSGAEGGVKPTPKRGKGWSERLRELHKADPDFAETAPERELAERLGVKTPGRFSKCDYWKEVLKPARGKVRSRKRLQRAGLKSDAAFTSKAQARSENWDQREAVDRLGDQMDAVEILDRRLLELHREDPTVAETATEREVAQRVGNLPEDCLQRSPYWRNVLKPRRDELQAMAKDSAIDGGH